MRDLVIFGTGGFAREVHELIEDVNADQSTWNVLGWLDGNKNQHGQELHGMPVLGGPGWTVENPSVQVVIAVGNPVARKRIAGSLGSGVRFGTLVHPTVVKGRRVSLGDGNIVCAGTIITTNIEFGTHVIVNIACTVGHDVKVKDFVTVAPGVNISGNVVVEQGTDLGTGSKIIQGVNIGGWSVVGAGAVVNRDLPANVTAVGIPARVIKERAEGWQDA